MPFEYFIKKRRSHTIDFLYVLQFNAIDLKGIPKVAFIAGTTFLLLQFFIQHQTGLNT